MLSLFKRIVIGCSIGIVCFTGCYNTKEYHDGSGKEWIEQQVQQGYLTEEEAKELLEQE